MMNDASHRFGDPSDRLGHGDSPPGPFNERTMEICEEIIGRYPSPAGALVPVLLLFQEEVGCCSTEVVEYTARLLGLRPARVQGVVTFYPMLRSVSSDGRCVRVCSGLSCKLMGADHVRAHLMERLGIDAEETESAGEPALQSCQCLGACSTAPVMMIDSELHESLSSERIDTILQRLG